MVLWIQRVAIKGALLWLTLTGGLLPTVQSQEELSQSTTGHSYHAAAASPTASLSLATSHRRVLQRQTTTSDFSNPRAPLHRTPDDQPEPQAISQDELQALWLQYMSPPPLGTINNRDDTANGDDDDHARRRFLLFVILLPAAAFVLGAYVLARSQKGILSRQRRQRQDETAETEGLFQTTDEKELGPEQPYHDKVPKKGFAEIKRNVI